MTTRRSFLAACLGGATLSVTLPESTETQANDKTLKEFINPRLGESYDLPVRLRVETDFTPKNTHLFTLEGLKLKYVSEMLIQFVPQTGRHWIGISVFVTDPLWDLKKLDQIDLGGLKIYSAQHNPATNILHLFAGGFCSLKVTRDLEELDVTFRYCLKCFKYTRRLIFESEMTADGWRGPIKPVDTAKKCMHCGYEYSVCDDPVIEEIKLKTFNQLYKCYMTPETSHLVLGIPERTKSLINDFPATLHIGNRPRWLAEEHGNNPVAQIEPKPSFMNDIFLRGFSQLFGGF